TRLKLELPAGVAAEGEWVLPRPSMLDGPTGRGPGYNGDVTFLRQLRIAKGQPLGELPIAIRVSYQACDDTICTRPEPITLRVAVEVIE
ncbi:MAG TPA: protein-disulfide reductase DsbD domain-containing protein, partial [Pirellulales bacterium]|nr:protein-disulfide reductase DsbD domain-containing protein [Pirellulales bacterium]